MLKKAQVHVLPAEKDIKAPTELGKYVSVLTKYTSHRLGDRWDYRMYMDGVIAENSHFLYFTTDEKVEDGDWTLFFDSAGNLFCTKPMQYEPGKGHVLNKGIRKVVATNNPSLWHLKTPHKGAKNPSLPKIGSDFVKAFAGNDGEIKEVVLKYADSGEKLETRNNNTVIIHPAKEPMFTEAEFKAGLANLLNDYNYYLARNEEHETFRSNNFNLKNWYQLRNNIQSAKSKLSESTKKLEHYEQALRKIRDIEYINNETDKEKVEDLKAIAFNALYESEHNMLFVQKAFK